MSTRLRIIYNPTAGYVYQGAGVKVYLRQRALNEGIIPSPLLNVKDLAEAVKKNPRARWVLVVREPRRIRKSRSLYQTACANVGIGRDLRDGLRELRRNRGATPSPISGRAANMILPTSTRQILFT